MSENDHERLPLTEDVNKSNKNKYNYLKCIYNPILYYIIFICICILIIVYIAKLIIYKVNYEQPDIPIEIKNFTIICDTWNGNNHPCLWNDKYCTFKDPCILSCKDYIKFSAGCFHSNCNERGRYDWCNDKPFGGQGGYLNYN